MANAQLENQINQAKSAGYNDNDIKSFLTQKGFNLSGTRYQGGVGGFINRNLSTIGSVALPAAADIATGGLAIPADVALSAAGGGLGKVASNATEGENLGSNVGSSTEQGALGGLLGGVGGKVIGKVAGGVGDTVDKAVTQKADQAVAQKAAETVAPFAPLNKTTLSDNDLKGTLDLFKNKIGMEPTPQNMHNAASIVTGENGIVSGVMRDVLGKAGNVDVGDVGQAAKSAINSTENVGVLGDASTKGTAGNNILNSVVNQKENGLLGGTGGVTKAGKIDSTANAGAVFKHIQTLGGQIKGLTNAEPGSLGHATKNVLQAVKSHLEDKLYNDAGVNKIVASSTFKDAPEASTAAIEHEVLRNGGTPELADHIINGINDAKTGQDLRSLQAPFVRADNLATAADSHAAGKGVVQDATAAVKGAEPDTANLHDISQIGSHVVTGNHFGLANTLGNMVKRGATSDAVLNPASKVTEAVGKANDILPGKGKVSNLLANTVGQGIVRAGQGSTEPTNNATTATTPATETSGATAPTQQFSQQDLLAAIAADPTHASTYEALYTALAKPDTDDLTTNQQNELTGSQNAIAAAKDYLSQIQNVQNNGGVDTGPVGGALGSLLGKYNIGGQKTANTYALKTSTADVAAQIAGGLSPSGRPSAALLKQVETSLPKVTDSPAAAQAKVSYLIGRLESVQQTEATPLTDIVSQVGQ